MQPITVERCRDVPLFRGLSDQQISEILGVTTTRDFKSGAVITKEGDVGTSFYILAEGSVDVLKKGQGGKEHKIAFIEAPSFFGEMALVSREPRVATITAQSSVRCGEITFLEFERLLASGLGGAEKIVLNMARGLAHRLRALDQEFLKLLEAKTSKEQKEAISEMAVFRAKLFAEWSV